MRIGIIAILLIFVSASHGSYSGREGIEGDFGILLPEGDFKYFVHLVEETDTVASICRRYSVGEGALRDLNHLLPMQPLVAGMKLRIPPEPPLEN